VKVTRAHYDALQALLNGKYSDRDRPEYKGDNDDVTRYKLDILKSITKEAASPQHTDNNEVEVNDDDDDGDRLIIPVHSPIFGSGLPPARENVGPLLFTTFNSRRVR
jgi:hypothetical protein